MGGAFFDGLAPARRGAKWGYLARDGAWQIEPYFSDARPFHEGVAAVQVGGTYAVVDKTHYFDGVLGVDLAPPLGDRMVPAHSGGKWGLIDVQGKYVQEPCFEEIRDAKEGRIPFREGQAWGFLNLAGKVLVKPAYLKAEPFDQGWARVSLFNGKTGFVDLQGNYSDHRMVEDLPTASGK